jgi:protein tyrosine phosphatase (PTP) superfamily phosphohydrolase (DUF442 family)
MLGLVAALGAPARAIPSNRVQERNDNGAWTTRIQQFAQDQSGPVRKALAQIQSNAEQMSRLDVHKAHDELLATVRKIDRYEARPTGGIARERLDAPIGNFGEVVPGQLYRGAQPSRAGVRWLAAQGVKTVVVLREPGVEETNYPGYSRADYLKDIRDHGMQVVEIPIKDGTIPTDGQIADFLRAAHSSANQPLFVHCSAGVGRTGIMAGMFLRSRGVPTDQVLAHCRRYGLSTSHPDQARQLRFIESHPLPGWQ